MLRKQGAGSDANRTGKWRRLESKSFTSTWERNPPTLVIPYREKLKVLHQQEQKRNLIRDTLLLKNEEAWEENPGKKFSALQAGLNPGLAV